MDFSAFKNPLVLAALAGSVIVTNVVTNNVSAPRAPDYSAEILSVLQQMRAEQQDARDALNQRIAAEEEALKRAFQPVEGLNPNRTGRGMNWKEFLE